MHQILKAHIDSKKFDHGYLLCGDGELCRKAAFEAAGVILARKGNLEAHPDFLYQKFEAFGIDDSRALKEWASSRPFFGSGKIAIMEIFSLSVESANALLKIFEEPNAGVHFFVISPSAEVIIPTLRSRLTVIRLGSSTSNSEVGLPGSGSAEEFLKLPSNNRLESIKKILTDKIKAVEFLNELEVYLERMIGGAQLWPRKALKEVQESRRFVFDRSPSLKMIMEHLVLVLPRL